MNYSPNPAAAMIFARDAVDGLTGLSRPDCLDGSSLGLLEHVIEFTLLVRRLDR